MSVHAGVERRLHILGKGVRRHCDDRDAFGIRTVFQTADGLCSFIPVQLRHHDVHKNQIKCARRLLGKESYRLFSVLHSGDFHPQLLKLNHGYLRIQVIVLGQKDVQTRQVGIADTQIASFRRSIVGNLHRQLDREAGADSLFAVNGNRSAQQVNILLCDGHTQPRSMILRPGAVFLL